MNETASNRRKPKRSTRDVEAVLDAQDWDALIPLIEGAGSEPKAVQLQLRSYAKAVLDWNRTASNLISRNDEERFVARHLVESLLPAKWINDCNIKRWIDFGSGAGLPAIPLALTGIGEHWHLVESRRVKTLFLAKVVSELKLTGFEVVRERLENLAGTEGYVSTFEGFTARATMALEPTLAIAATLVKKGGYAFLWKGSRRAEELAGNQWRESWQEEGILSIEGGETSISKFLRTK